MSSSKIRSARAWLDRLANVTLDFRRWELEERLPQARHAWAARARLVMAPGRRHIMVAGSTRVQEYQAVTGLVIENVEKEYPTRGEPLSVLQDVSLSLAAGENAAIIGPSGSGKSTLLHIIGGLETPTSGSVTLDEQDPFALSDHDLARFRNHNVGFIFQDHHLLPQLSVLENVLIPALADGAPDKAVVARAHDLIERVGLKERIDHRPAELSGGERQRVAVARALLMSPKLLLADEPTGSLDRTTAQDVSQLLLRLQEQEDAILIVVTHSLELAAKLQQRWEIDCGRLQRVTD